jgi:DNA modification methylase
MNASRPETPNSDVERPASDAGGGPAPHIETIQRERQTPYSGTARTAGSGRQVEIVPIVRLTAYKGNARTHTKKQIRQIADSITRFGFCNPILIDDANQIIAGHGRVEAAKSLGYDGVPTLRIAHLSEAEKRAYVVADNRLAELAGWDREILAIELQGLIDLEFDVEVTGFDMGEIDIILDEADQGRRESAEAEDDIPERVSGPPISRIGDLWLLGTSRLLCGDARDNSSYDLLLNGGKAELVFADPPYNVSINGHVCGLGEIQHREFAMASGEMSPEAFTDFLKSTFACLSAHTTDGSIHYVCMDWRHIGEMMEAGNSAYSELKNLVVWAKSNAGMGSFYRSQHELIFVWKSGTAPHLNNVKLGQYGRSRTNVWKYDGISTMRPGRHQQLAWHPTVKPAALVAGALKDCSRRNGIVLDPFAGSGTIFIAAEQTGRRAHGIEIDPGYIDVAIKRWQRFTGKSALLAGTDHTFEEIEGQRAHSTPVEVKAEQAAIPANREAA